MPGTSQRSTVDNVLIAATLAMMIFCLYLIFFYVPTEATMGVVQRIFYFHVPAAWVSFIAFFFVFIYSFLYLARSNKKWDSLAGASAEVGVLFSSANLFTGPIWAKPVWGIWWTWDARLTLTLMLWLTYVGYLMLRHYVVDAERRATYAAVVGVVGFVNVPLVYFSIRWWRTQHPQPVIAGGEDSGLEPSMRVCLYTCFAMFLLLFTMLMRMRKRVQALQDELDGLHQQLETVR